MNRAALIAVLAVAGFGAVAQAQGRRGGGEPGVGSPGELQQMFDAYALLQAQEQLGIGDEQYPQFLRRFKALQDLRRQTLQARARLLQELRRLVMEQPPDEGRIKERLTALQESDARARRDAESAYAEIDSGLDVTQQAKFRIFEEQMERRKLEILTRVRLNRLRGQ
jgi:hypothetical protein